MKRVVVLVLVSLLSALFFSPIYSLAIASNGGPTYAIIHYYRADGDYGDHTTGDYNDFWGLHLWGDIDEVIEWTAPKPFLGEDEYGRFAWVKLMPGAANVGFIVHKGDTKDGTAADRFFNPSVTPEIWLRGDDATTYTSQTSAQGFVTIHYHRPGGDYGDPTSNDFNDFWGLHVWTGALNLTVWNDPVRPDRFDIFGPVFKIDIIAGAPELAYIIHRGDEKDPGPDQSLVFENYGYEVWQLQDAVPESPYILPMVTVLTPVEAIDEIGAAVENLVVGGYLTQGQGNSLSSKLYAATLKLNQGKTAAAINLLWAFINEVNGFVSSGKLTPAQGQPLIDAAQQIIDQIDS